MAEITEQDIIDHSYLSWWWVDDHTQVVYTTNGAGQREYQVHTISDRKLVPLP